MRSSEIVAGLDYVAVNHRLDRYDANPRRVRAVELAEYRGRASSRVWSFEFLDEPDPLAWGPIENAPQGSRMTIPGRNIAGPWADLGERVESVKRRRIERRERRARFEALAELLDGVEVEHVRDHSIGLKFENVEVAAEMLAWARTQARFRAPDRVIRS